MSSTPAIATTLLAFLDNDDIPQIIDPVFGAALVSLFLIGYIVAIACGIWVVRKDKFRRIQIIRTK